MLCFLLVCRALSQDLELFAAPEHELGSTLEEVVGSSEEVSRLRQARKILESGNDTLYIDGNPGDNVTKHYTFLEDSLSVLTYGLQGVDRSSLLQEALLRFGAPDVITKSGVLGRGIVLWNTDYGLFALDISIKSGGREENYSSVQLIYKTAVAWYLQIQERAAQRNSGNIEILKNEVSLLVTSFETDSSTLSRNDSDIGADGAEIVVTEAPERTMSEYERAARDRVARIKRMAAVIFISLLAMAVIIMWWINTKVKAD